jgi:hypothetical protein
MSITPPEEDVRVQGPWVNNAELMFDAATRLNYVPGKVLDLTYGHGNFWTLWRPESLTTNDLNPEKGDHHNDVRDPPPIEWCGRFDTTVLDIPYAMTGTRDQGEFDERYGLDLNIKDTDVPPLLEAGVRYACWCRANKGYVLVKCQDQQWRNKLFEQTDLVRRTARDFDLRVVDRFHLKNSVRKQRSQKSARNNYSTLMVLGQ